AGRRPQVGHARARDRAEPVTFTHPRNRRAILAPLAVGRVFVTVLVLATMAAMLPAAASAAPVGGASYSGTTGQKERIALTVARTKPPLSRFATAVRAPCSDRQRDWTEYILPAGNKSLALKKGKVSKRISLAPPRSPAVGNLTFKVTFGSKAVTGTVSG